MVPVKWLQPLLDLWRYVCIHIDLYSYACVYVCNRWLQWFIVVIIVCSHRLSPSTLRAERKTSQNIPHVYEGTISIKLRTV